MRKVLTVIDARKMPYCSRCGTPYKYLRQRPLRCRMLVLSLYSRLQVQILANSNYRSPACELLFRRLNSIHHFPPRGRDEFRRIYIHFGFDN